MADIDEAALVAGRVLQEFGEDAGAATGQRIAASLGIAAYPSDRRDAETLLRNADAAMYEAKREGGGYRLFSAGGAAQRRAG